MLSRSPAHPTGFIEPCLPTPSRTVPDGSRWAFEVKHDGYRFIARRDGNRVRVFSRDGKDWSNKVPAIVDALRALPVTSATLDGEGVLSVAHRAGPHAAVPAPPSCSPLTCSSSMGRTRRHPWEIRRATLTGLLRKAGPGVRLSEHVDGDGETIFRHACALGAEGIVAKRRDRPYRSGRCADWIKVRNPSAPAATRIMEWDR